MAISVCLVTTTVHQFATSQTNPNFNVNLLFDYSSAEQAVLLYEDQLFNTQGLAELRASRIASSTTGLIANRVPDESTLLYYLDSLKHHQQIRDDVYQLENGRDSVTAIKELIAEMKKRNFSRKIVATVEQIFPQDASVNTTIPVYVVAFGHENVDAYVRRIIWHGDTPQFVGETEGELTIVINLAHAVRYAREVDERLLSILNVVSHEVFHAAFGAYKDGSSRWKRYYARYRQPIDELLDLTHNEGVAYYLSLDQQGRGYLPRGWDIRIREAFDSFNSSADKLLSKNLSRDRVAEIIRKANLSGYWESFGSMTGMFIAREIDLKLGRASLVETIELGPFDFFKKYAQLARENINLPSFSPLIQHHLE